MFQFLKSNPKEKTLTEKISETFKGDIILETERLLLKKISAENVEDMYEYSKDADVTRYLTWSPHSSVKETERYVKLLGKKYENGVFWDFALILKENNRMIGTCGYTSADDKSNSVEIGYVLAQDMWGMGLATEAAKCVAKYAVEQFGAEKITAKMMDGNQRSMKVMKKLGMKLEGTFSNAMLIKGEYKTIHVFYVNSENLVT